MFNWFKNKKNHPGKKKEAASDPSQELIIPPQEKRLFERALQCYVFAHHVPHQNLPDELRDQMKYLGNVLYSLIFNWLKNGRPSLEYMDFLNGKLSELRQRESEFASHLEILPSEIPALELQPVARFRFQDEETEIVFRLFYDSETGTARFDPV